MTAQSPPWPPLILSQTYGLRSNVGAFTSPLTGKAQRRMQSGSRWEFDVAFATLGDELARAWVSFLAYCQEEALTFYWSPYPLGRLQNYPTGFDAGTTCDSTIITCDSSVITCDSGSTFGSPYVGVDGQTGGSLIIYGLISGVAFVAGDHLAFDNGVYREMHIITANATADGSGHVTLQITPDIRRSPPINAPVYFDGHVAQAAIRCACEVYVADNAQAAFSMSGFQSGMAFKLIEAIR